MASNINTGDNAWLLISVAMVQLMCTSLGLFYGGMTSEKAVVNTIMLSFGTMAVVTVVWVLVGYSLAFAPSVSTGVIGDLSLALLNYGDTPRAGTTLPEASFSMFQLMFAAITPALISGAVVEKMNYIAFMWFAALWHIFVYCPLAHWIFFTQGWLATWGVIDFAGGYVVETASGVSAFVLAYWLKSPKKLAPVSPHNVPYVMLGAGLLWFGWFGFNAGSALSAGYLASRALTNTHLAGCAAMIAWGVLEIAFNGPRFGTGKASAMGAATGAVVGLVVITPTCGFIMPMVSLGVGAFASLVVFFVMKLVKKFGPDDRLDVFAVHGVGGMVGVLLNGLLATTDADSPINGSFYGGGGAPFARQLAALCVTVLLCTVGTTVIYWVMWAVARALGLSLTIAVEHIDDIDASQHGEMAYYNRTHQNLEAAVSDAYSRGSEAGAALSAAAAGLNKTAKAPATTLAPVIVVSSSTSFSGGGGSSDPNNVTIDSTVTDGSLSRGSSHGEMSVEERRRRLAMLRTEPLPVESGSC